MAQQAYRMVRGNITSKSLAQLVVYLSTSIYKYVDYDLLARNFSMETIADAKLAGYLKPAGEGPTFMIDFNQVGQDLGLWNLIRGC